MTHRNFTQYRVQLHFELAWGLEPAKGFQKAMEALASAGHPQDGATLVPTLGYWQGEQEQSACLVLYLNDVPDMTTRLEMANAVAEAFHQEEVWLTVDRTQLAIGRS